MTPKMGICPYIDICMHELVWIWAHIQNDDQNVSQRYKADSTEQRMTPKKTRPVSAE